MKFPKVSGSNLLRQKLTLPEDLQGSLNLVFVPFWQWQQMEVNSWLPLATQFEKTTPGLHAYELPTIQSRSPLSRWFINEGMRAGIPNQKTREHTITLYIDKGAFRRALEMNDEDHIYVLLLDRTGSVIWRGRGSYSAENAASLERVLQNFSQIPAAL